MCLPVEKDGLKIRKAEGHVLIAIEVAKLVDENMRGSVWVRLMKIRYPNQGTKIGNKNSS